MYTNGNLSRAEITWMRSTLQPESKATSKSAMHSASDHTDGDNKSNMTFERDTTDERDSFSVPKERAMRGR